VKEQAHPMNDTTRTMCLIEELETARNLIMLGFGELQEIRISNDFYHLPQLLLASGLERLLKCYFCLVHEARNGRYPDTSFLTSLRHDLQIAKSKLVDEYFSTHGIPLLEDDLEFLKNDALLDRIIHILSEFGKRSRYYNLDIVTGSPKPPIDPKSEWESLETDIEDPSPYLSGDSMETLHRDYYPRVNAKILAKLERLVRAVSMQFTLGKHGGRLLQLSPIVNVFIMLKDEEFGTTDYRRSVKRLARSRDKWNKRSKEKVLRSRWPATLVSKSQFGKDWPFRADEVVVECREKMFCVVNIQGYDFALNGSARSHLGFPDPHNAGIAILGRSTGPFLDLALSLAREDAKGEAE